MNSSTNAVEDGRHRVRTFLPALIALLALAAICAGLLGMQSARADKAMLNGRGPVTLSSAEATTGPVQVAGDAAGAAPMVTGASVLPVGLQNGASCDSACLVGCAMVGVTCAMLFVLASVVFLTRLPALYGRPLAACRPVMESLAVTLRHNHRPSLTALCISRV